MLGVTNEGAANSARPEHESIAAPSRPLWLKVLRALPLVLGVVHFGIFVWVVVQRFRFPVELEWMSGGVTEHIERVLQGKQLYVAPSATFIPYLYTPLHYWLSAIVAKVVPIVSAPRVVSLIATAVTAAMVFRATKRLGGSLFWSLVAATLYVGAYSVTGYWYDLDRSDSLLTAMLSSGFVVALESEGLAAMALAGALLGGAFLAKQPGSIFFLAAAAGLLIARRRKQAGALVAGGLAVLVPVVGYLQLTTDGWFWFYCLKMPGSHGVKAELITTFFVVDASKAFALFAAVYVVVTQFAVRAFRSVVPSGGPTDTPSKEAALFGAMVAASLFTSATSRLHAGGYINVLMFLTTFGSIAFAVLASRAVERSRLPLVEGLLLAAATLQLVHFLYDPGEAAPNAGRVRDAKIVADRVRTLERDGEVVVHGRGYLTEQRHFHIMALMDVLRGGLPIPADLERGLSERKFAAYVIDEFGELGLEPILGRRSELYELVTRNYFIAQRLDDREPPPVVGWMAHPTWVLRPSNTPLTSITQATVS